MGESGCGCAAMAGVAGVSPYITRNARSLLHSTGAPDLLVGAAASTPPNQDSSGLNKEGTTLMSAESILPVDARSAKSVSNREAYDIVKEAYVYAYPLMLQYITLRQATNFAGPTGIPSQGPFNQFSHGTAFPATDF